MKDLGLFYMYACTSVMTVVLIAIVFGELKVAVKGDKQEYCYDQCQIESVTVFEWIKKDK